MQKINMPITFVELRGVFVLKFPRVNNRDPQGPKGWKEHHGRARQNPVCGYQQAS